MGARLRRASALAKKNVSVKRFRIIGLTFWRNITAAGGFSYSGNISCFVASNMSADGGTNHLFKENMCFFNIYR